MLASEEEEYVKGAANKFGGKALPLKEIKTAEPISEDQIIKASQKLKAQKQTL